jgi:phage terminase large subunit GpA-like protein
MSTAATLEADAGAIVRAVWREFLSPPPLLTVTEWAEKHRILSTKDSAEPGPYSVARTPYAREPQDCLSAESNVEEVVLIWGAQTGKTTIGGNWVGYIIDVAPGPLMIVQPTKDLAKRYSRQRFTSMIEASPRLRGKVTENKSRDASNTMLLKDFAGGLAVLAGANSAADLRSVPIRDLFLDEVDGYPLDVDGEGDPCQLAQARQTTFARRKRLKTSTPTLKDFSRIEAAYNGSDRCRYYVACPHCGSMQWLQWGADKPFGIKWSKHEDGSPIPESVRYVCEHNGCEILEHHKTAMLRGPEDGGTAHWMPERPGAQAGRVRGFHLSSLYSPLGWLSWAELVVEWHAAMEKSRAGDVALLRTFVNTRLAETFEEKGDRVASHELEKRAPDLPVGVVSRGHFVRTLGVDVQGDRLEVFDWAFGRGMQSQLVERRVIYGDPALQESDEGSPWAALTEYRRTPRMQQSGRQVPLLACFVDSGGHHTQAVYAYGRAHRGAHVYAVKGASIAGKPVLGKPSDQDVNWRGERIKKGVKLWPIGTDTAKAVIYGRLRIAQAGPGYVTLSKHLPAEVFEQLTAERLVTRYVKGRARLEWVKPNGARNEALDCAVYALAAAHFVGIDRWKEGEWSKWESRVQTFDLVDAMSSEPPAVVAAPLEAPAAPEVEAAPPRRPSRGRFGKQGWSRL